jgi:hypothetical protein
VTANVKCYLTAQRHGTPLQQQALLPAVSAEDVQLARNDTLLRTDFDPRVRPG